MLYELATGSTPLAHALPATTLEIAQFLGAEDGLFDAVIEYVAAAVATV
jgi:hypothetical protein